MLAGTTAHCKTNASPRISLTTNTATLTTMINAVMAGKCWGGAMRRITGLECPRLSSPLPIALVRLGRGCPSFRAPVVSRCSELGKQAGGLYVLVYGGCPTHSRFSNEWEIRSSSPQVAHNCLPLAIVGLSNLLVSSVAAGCQPHYFTWVPQF